MVENKKFDRIAPIILNKMVISLRINDKKIPLKKKMPVTYFTGDFLESFSNIEEYIDFSILFNNNIEIEDWSEEELRDFMETLSEQQQEIIKIITKENKISRDNLVNKLINHFNNAETFNNKTLAGVVAGMNRRVNRLRKEKFFIIRLDTYKINEKYRELLDKICFLR